MTNIQICLAVAFSCAVCLATAVLAAEPAVDAPQPPAADVPAAETPPPAAAAAEESPPVKFEGPRDWFNLYGIDASHFEKFRPGEPFGDDESEPLLKVLYRMRRFDLSQLEGWAHREMDPASLARDHKALQGDIYLVRGRVQRVDVLEPVPEIAERYELEHYYRCQFELVDGGSAIVYSTDVPAPWRKGGEVNQRAGAMGAFLKPTGGDDDPAPLFAAARIAWYPDTPLGNLGFDYSLFDLVEPRRSPELEPFYRLMAIVNRTPSGELLAEADARLREMVQQRMTEDASAGKPVARDVLKDPLRRDRQQQDRWHYSVVPLFRDSENQQGKLIALSGTARQVQKVIVDDPDIRRRFGIDHYYQVGVFTDDSDGNPVFFCVLELPKGMPLGDHERYGEAVRVAGFFFKVWSYRIDVPRGADIDERTGLRRQPAPLLIGRDLTWYPVAPPPPRSPVAAAIAIGLLFIAVAFAWISVWRLNRGKGRTADVPEKISVPE